jgi:hypothetical protein
MLIRGILLSIVLAAGLGAASAQQPPAAPPPGSQAPVGNWVITYIEVAPGSEAKALAAFKTLKAASAKTRAICRWRFCSATASPTISR